MSVKAFSTLEQVLASDLLCGFCGPLNMLPLELSLAKTTEEKLSVAKKFIENHLSKDGKPTVVDLQDERISELFDESMKNMARDTVQKALKHKQQMESLARSAVNLAYLMDSFKPQTWKDYAMQGIERVGATISKTINRSSVLRGGVDAAYCGLSRVGIISKKQSAEEKTDIVLIEEDDDWHEVETHSSYGKRISIILKNWQNNPSILLEMDPAKTYIDYLRNDLLPKAKKNVPVHQ